MNLRNDGARISLKFVYLASFCSRFENVLLKRAAATPPTPNEGHVLCWWSTAPLPQYQEYYRVQLQNTQILHSEFMFGQKVHTKFVFYFSHSMLCRFRVAGVLAVARLC